MELRTLLFFPFCFIFRYLFKFLLQMYTICTVDIIIYLVQMDSLKKTIAMS